MLSQAPGIPEELQTVSVSVTNITIQWDRVNCRDRNGHTDSYRVVSYPTLSPNDRVAQRVVGTEGNDRMFSITGRPPRTNYTFEVQAVNPNLDVSGPPAFYTESTTAPQGKGSLGKMHTCTSNLHCFFSRPWFSPGWSVLP